MLVYNTNFRFLSDIINQVIHLICRVDYNGVLGERHDRVRNHSTLNVLADTSLVLITWMGSEGSENPAHF